MGQIVALAKRSDKVAIVGSPSPAVKDIDNRQKVAVSDHETLFRSFRLGLKAKGRDEG